MSSGARLRNVLLLVKDVPSSVRFFRDGLGLRVASVTPRWAELDTGGGGTPLELKATEGEAATTAGYTPFLSFDVADLDTAVTSLIGLGAALDGPVRHTPHGKAAALRSPDGHMLGLHEA